MVMVAGSQVAYFVVRVPDPEARKYTLGRCIVCARNPKRKDGGEGIEAWLFPLGLGDGRMLCNFPYPFW